MASTDYDFILTRDELIDESYRKIGVLADGENISSEQLDTANKKLNLIIKAWEGNGIYLWTYLTETVSTVASTADYSIPSTNGMHYIEKAYIVEDDSDVILERLSVKQYADVMEKDREGRPISFYQNTADGEFTLWPVPDAVYDIKIFGYRRLKDWEVSSDTGEFPARWQIALKYGLAVELGEDYKIPLKEIQYLRGIAATEYLKATKREVDVADCNFVRGAY